MTPHQFAKVACDNFLPTGACLGVRYSDDLTRVAVSPHPACLLENGKACRHFEECIIPQAPWAGNSDGAAKIASDRMDAVRAYKQLHAAILQPARRCPECGLNMQPRQRLCDSCRKKHRRATQSAADSKRRSDANS